MSAFMTVMQAASPIIEGTLSQVQLWFLQTRNIVNHNAHGIESGVGAAASYLAGSC